LLPITNKLTVIGENPDKAGSPAIKNKLMFKNNIKQYKNKNLFIRSLYFLRNQLVFCAFIIQPNAINSVIVFYACSIAVFPMIVAKLSKKKIIVIATGSASISSSYENNSPLQTIIHKAIFFLEHWGMRLADVITIYSPSFISFAKLESYKNKVEVLHEHFIDTTLFIPTKTYDERPTVIGYIGRFSPEKGILNFIRSLPAIIKTIPGCEIIIIGQGELQTEMVMELKELGISNAKLTGWIPQTDLPAYLNIMRLLVIPSYTEGLPGVLIEALSCRTPVLTTPVGAIPDIIKDGETGFIMPNNSPECIADNVIRALNQPAINAITRNGRKLIETDFTFDKAKKGYSRILKQLG
jgi:glycosyltransferase involved in cell wall biosynthesis